MWIHGCYRQLKRAAANAYHQQHVPEAHLRCPVLLQHIDADLTRLGHVRVEDLRDKKPCAGKAQLYQQAFCDGHPLLVLRAPHGGETHGRTDHQHGHSRLRPARVHRKRMVQKHRSSQYDRDCKPFTPCSRGGAKGGAPFGGDAGKSCPRTSFILKTPPSNGVPAAAAGGSTLVWQQRYCNGSGLIGVQGTAEP